MSFSRLWLLLGAAFALNPAIALAGLSIDLSAVSLCKSSGLDQDNLSSESVRPALQASLDDNFTHDFHHGGDGGWNGSEACASLGYGAIAIKYARGVSGLIDQFVRLSLGTRNNRAGGFSDHSLTKGFWRPGHTPLTSRSFS